MLLFSLVLTFSFGNENMTVSMKFRKLIGTSCRWANHHKCVIFALACFLCAFAIWHPRFVQSYRQYQDWSQKNLQLAQAIEESQSLLVQKQHFIHKFIHQPEFREMVVRKQLGFIKKQEYIVRFYTPENTSDSYPIQF